MKYLPKKYIIEHITAIAYFALNIGLFVGLTMKNKDISSKIHDNTANDKEIPSSSADEKERPSTTQVGYIVANLSHMNHQK